MDEPTALLAELRRELDRDDGAAERGVGWLVHTLRQRQVSTMFVDPPALAGRTLLELDGPPWIAGDRDDPSADVVAARAPAAAALIRAAELTDATVVLVEPGRLPHHAEVAALLRWPVRTAAID